MSTIAGPQDVRIHLSGGTNNVNVNKSTGGSISNTYIPFYSRSFNNLWSDVSERQLRYGYKDTRVVYIKNVHANQTFKNARVYWNQTDNFTSMQIGRAPVNGTENTTVSLAALLPTSEPIPPSMWDTAVAFADTFRIIQDFNNVNRNQGGRIPQAPSFTRKGVGVEDSSAAIYNQKIARISFTMVRFGDPQGPINCKIWDRSGDEVASLGSVDSDDITPAGGVDMKDNIHTFTNTSNQHAMEVGDVIGLEYPGSGIDEDSGAVDDRIIMGLWEWSGDDNVSDPDNSQYDITGTNLSMWNESQGEWIVAEGGAAEVVYRAEVFGSGGGGGGDPCNPDPGPGDPGGPGTPEPEEPRGYLIIQDFNDVNAQTGYSIGAAGPNNAFRRAVKVDNTTATILSAPIARMTFLLRRIGNPTGSVFCRIWSSSGTVMQTIGQLAVSGITNQGGQWTQVPFTLEENTYQMRVGDLIGVEYTTGNATDHIVMAGWNFQAVSQVADDFELSGLAGAADKNGVKMIYANNGNFNYNWEIPSNSDSMRWDLSNPPINMEMTGYFMKSSPASDTVSCKIRGGKHTDGESSAGCCYIPQFPCEGGSMQFEIECPHPDNHDCPISGTHGNALSLAQWHGYKVVVWNTTNNCVHIEAYQDKGDNSGGTPTNTWEKVFVHDDCTGNCGNISNPLLRPKGSSSQATFRIDNNSGTQGKWLSIVEIQPGNAQPPGGGGGSPGGRDVPGTSIARWNGSIWAADDGGNSDLVFKAERFAVIGDEPDRDPIIIDPGTKRKPTSFDQGIVIPPLGPGDYKSLILERVFPPISAEIQKLDITQQLIVEVDSTTEAGQATDPNQPPPAISTTFVPVIQAGPYPIPQGFTRVGNFITFFDFEGKFETNYAAGAPGPSLRWNCPTMTKLNMLVGFEFKIGPRHGTRGNDSIEVKFPRCATPKGEMGSYIAMLNWDANNGPSSGSVGSEFPHPVTGTQDYNLDDPNPSIGNIKDGNWHGFLAACYNDSAGNVIIKQWYNASASGNAEEYVFVGSAKDTSGNIPPAPKMPYASEGHTTPGGDVHPMQIRIDEIPSNDVDAGAYVYPSANLEIRNAFTCEIQEGARTSSFNIPNCPPGQKYDPLQKVCVIDPGSAGTTVNGIVLPSLPTSNYSLDPIDYNMQSDHKANGSFREHFLRGNRDLNSVMIGGYFNVDGPDDEEITAKLGGGVQTPSNAGIAGRCYNIDISLDGNLVTVKKETRHGEYEETGIQNVINLGPRQGHYTGVIFMKCNIMWLGDPAVRLMAWVDTAGMNDAGTFTAAKQNWIQVLDAIDSGYWPDKPWITGAVPGDSIATIRVDQQAEPSYDCKFGFAARIRGGPAY